MLRRVACCRGQLDFVTNSLNCSIPGLGLVGAEVVGSRVEGVRVVGTGVVGAGVGGGGIGAGVPVAEWQLHYNHTTAQRSNEPHLSCRF